MMVFYNAYIPLLIRQANDVAENPGPTIFDVIDPTRTLGPFIREKIRRVLCKTRLT